MKFPFLASTLIFCAYIAFVIHRQKNIEESQREDFWEREREANNTRRKSLDGLDYIKIPLDMLPMDVLLDNPKVAECVTTITNLSESPIVNLTGFSNTDLKLEYGAPNIDILSLYDQRYTTLARTLQTWASLLYENGDKTSAQVVLEYAISTRTDVSGTYKLLASIYNSKGDLDSIRGLIPVAESINSPLKASIIKSLNEYLN